MNIKSIQQNNTNFEALNSPRRLKLLSQKVSSKQLLKSQSIKECAKKYDVFVRRGQPNGMVDTLRHELIGAGIGLGIGGTFVLAALPSSVPIGLMVTTPLLLTALGFCFAGIPPSHEAFRYEYIIKGKKDDLETEEFYLKSLEDLDKIPDITKEIDEKRKEQFIIDIAENYPQDGVYSAKDILNIVKDKSIRKNYTNDEIFNFSIDINNNSSLLIRFFDIKRTKENAEEYDQIASLIKSTPNIDFRQQDNIGITILENILNSENSDALEIVKDIEFEYTPYLDKIFNDIKDEGFKQKARGLKIKFPDAAECLKNTKSIKCLQETLACLDSPFCNSRREAVKIWANLKKHVSPKDLKEINAVLYKYLPENLRIN